MTNAPKELLEFKLEEDNELRFEVAACGELTVELIGDAVGNTERTCEMFGTELVPHKKYTFVGGTRGALYTWHGCTLELCGQTESQPYLAKKTPMIVYINTHAALEALRSIADSKSIASTLKIPPRGPRCMIVGPTDVGKSTYCRILCSYAARQKRTPIYVDLDVGQGSISVPGTVGAIVVERPADVVTGLDRRYPIIYNYGHLSPGDNVNLYNANVEALANVINERCDKTPDIAVSGLIINTCGWVKGAGYRCLVTAAEAFEVDVVIVLDHERLYIDLQRDLPNFVKVVHQSKSGGVEERTREQRIQARRTRCREYFYGSKKEPMFPHSFTVKFDEVTLVKVGAENLPEACLPIGMKTIDLSTTPIQIDPELAHKNHIFAVNLASDLTQVVSSNVAGFVLISEVDLEKKLLTIMMPQKPPLPAKILIYSDVTWMDDK